MAFRYAVHIVEQCRIAPPSGSVSTTSLPLSYLDLFWLSMPTVQRLFFYQVDHSKAHFFNTILPNIKHSLSLTLQHFFPLAGTLTWPQDSPKPVILYVDGESAVSLTVAESDYDFHHLSGNHPIDVNDSYPLVPELPNISTADKLFPVLALQVTLFPNNGVCIGLTYRHAVADGRILIQFVKSWASLCRSQGGAGDTSFLMTESPLCYDRTMAKDATGIDMKMLNALKKAINISKDTFNLPGNNPIPAIDEKLRATFVLGRSDIMRIKQWVLTRLEKDEQQGLRLSTFVITCAYIWVCLIKAQRDGSAGEDDDPMEFFGFVVDCRAKLDPPLPITYFGNCLRCAIAEGKGSELIGEDGIAIAAARIAKVITTIKDGEGILKDMEIVFSSDFSFVLERCVSVAGSTKLGVYEADFGWGVPKKTEVVSIATTGAISLSECPKEVGAVEVGVARGKFQMEVFASLFAKTLEALPPICG